ncbi:MAG: argininosuccinate lyase [Candidatus Nanoarchaeia archaeon]
MTLWSGRFSEERKKALIELTESISFDKKLANYDIQGSLAHVKMLASIGILSEEASQKISSTLKIIAQRIAEGDFKFKSELEDIHMHIESELIKMLGDEGARLHTGRSRNDQIALDERLYLKATSKLIISKILTLQKSLLVKAEENAETIMPGFTHLQHAQPVLFAHHLLAYVEMLDRDIGRITDCAKRFDSCPLGAGAIAGSTLPLNREMTAKELEFANGPTRNSMDSVADRDFICEFIAALAIFAMHMSRLSEDIILWCSQEFNFIELGDAYCTGSSLMPQKKNPDIAELTRGKTGRIYGDLMSILTTCKALPMTYNRDLQEDKEPLFDAVETTIKILNIYPGMIESISVNKEKMLSAASDPCLMATDLAEYLVKKGVPFRMAHSKVGRLVKYCREKNIPLNKLTLEEMKTVIPEADENCLTLFSPEKSISAREIFGATGFCEVRKQIGFWKKKLEI